jgi:hypothetical protein
VELVPSTAASVTGKAARPEFREQPRPKADKDQDFAAQVDMEDHFRRAQIPALINFENRRSPELGWAMRRRSTTSSKLPNARNRKAKALKAVRHSSSSVARQKTAFARLRRERDAAFEQFSAASDVLKVISASAGTCDATLK